MMATTTMEKTMTEEIKAVSSKRRIMQVFDTIYFEFQKNFKKTMILFVLNTVLFALFLIVQEVQEYQGVEPPEKAVAYISSYLAMISFLVMISAIAFGGSIISVDFEKQTGNIIFPKISRSRLLLGRFIAMYTLNALVILYYYVIVSLTTYIKYDELPVKIWTHLGWTLMYTLLVLSFVTFFSSFMRSTSATVVMSIMMLLILFDIIVSILMVTGSAIEPLFSITYFGSIINYSFNGLPEERFMEQIIPIGEGDPLIFRIWLTPSVNAALYGMLIYTAALLIFAYLLFKRRQMK
jgi:ABC-2 type transport system permease protein